MRSSESWAKGLMTQNIVVRTGQMNVVSHFGSKAPPKPKARDKDDKKFVVGETEIGGEEVV